MIGDAHPSTTPHAAPGVRALLVALLAAWDALPGPAGGPAAPAEKTLTVTVWLRAGWERPPCWRTSGPPTPWLPGSAGPPAPGDLFTVERLALHEHTATGEPSPAAGDLMAVERLAVVSEISDTVTRDRLLAEMQETESCVTYFRLAEALRRIDPEAYRQETEDPAPPAPPPAMKARDRLRHTRTEPSVASGDDLASLLHQLVGTVRDPVQALGQLRPRVIVKEIKRDADGRMTSITETTTATLADPDPAPDPPATRPWTQGAA